MGPIEKLAKNVAALGDELTSGQKEDINRLVADTDAMLVYREEYRDLVRVFNDPAVKDATGITGVSYELSQGTVTLILYVQQGEWDINGTPRPGIFQGGREDTGALPYRVKRVVMNGIRKLLRSPMDKLVDVHSSFSLPEPTGYSWAGEGYSVGGGLRKIKLYTLTKILIELQMKGAIDGSRTPRPT